MLTGIEGLWMYSHLICDHSWKSILFLALSCAHEANEENRNDKS